MSENTNTTAAKTGAATTTTKKKITAKNLSATDVASLLRDIDDSIFQADENSLLIFHLPFCDAMVKYLKLKYFFGDDLKDIDEFGDFFNDLVAGKFKDYIAAMDKCETSRLIDEAVKVRKQIVIGRLQSPVTETLTKVNEILDTFADEFKGIEPDAIKKFINDFANFAQENNPESITDTMLKKVAAENKAAQSKNRQKKG